MSQQNNKKKLQWCKFLPDCGKGSDCSFAHCREELCVPPTYKTILCQDFFTFGYCLYGENCHDAHSVEEIHCSNYPSGQCYEYCCLIHQVYDFDYEWNVSNKDPAMFYKMKMCFNGFDCTNKNCTYAHSNKELRVYSNHKTSMCYNHLIGKCKNDTSCTYAHTKKELHCNFFPHGECKFGKKCKKIHQVYDYIDIKKEKVQKFDHNVFDLNNYEENFPGLIIKKVPIEKTNSYENLLKQTLGDFNENKVIGEDTEEDIIKLMKRESTFPKQMRYQVIKKLRDTNRTRRILFDEKINEDKNIFLFDKDEYTDEDEDENNENDFILEEEMNEKKFKRKVLKLKEIERKIYELLNI